VEKRVILVSGVSNSGKTQSIREYLHTEGIFHSRRGDITLVFPLGRKGFVVGVASGGDTPRIIMRNFRFLNGYRWDVVVCASKSRGATIETARREAARANATLTIVQTRRVPRNQQGREHRRIAQLVRKAI
jgi:hypothetical protein